MQRLNLKEYTTRFGICAPNHIGLEQEAWVRMFLFFCEAVAAPFHFDILFCRALEWSAECRTMNVIFPYQPDRVHKCQLRPANRLHRRLLCNFHNR